MPSALGPTPNHLPQRLAITLWDFSWYTQAGEGEAFADLDEAFDELLERGYNTVRICAAPLLLYGEHNIDPTRLELSNMGGDVGQGTRWYDAAGGVTLDLRSRLLQLMESARRHGVCVIISSWEYQQSSAFAKTSEWFDMLDAIAPTDRFDRLAEAYIRMLDHFDAQGLSDAVAYVELHNEVDISLVGAEGRWTEADYEGRKGAMEQAIARVRAAHPRILVTTCYGVPPFLDMAVAPENSQVAHHHLYIYGVLGALRDEAGFGLEPPEFPTDALRPLLRPDAPAFDDYATGVEPWRFRATILPRTNFYAFDWADGDAWDVWLYRNYALYEAAMKRGIEDRLRAIAAWARRHNVPAVIGEGWVGYIPMGADFEDGPIGRDLSSFSMRLCAELGFWGAVVGSSRAATHSGWADVAHQRQLNSLFLGS